MKKIITVVVVLMVILTSTAFAYGKRAEDFNLTTGVCLEMEDGYQIVSIRMNDDDDHIIYFEGTNDSDIINMHIDTNGRVVWQESFVYYNDEVVATYIWYACYCVEQGWL